MTVACRACGAQIIWAVTVGSGRRMPLDTKPEQRVIIREHGEIIECKVVATYVPHWATCPNAAEFRSKNGRGKTENGANGSDSNAKNTVTIDGATRTEKP